MAIYTHNGDLGETSALGRKTLRKDDPCIEACGSVDELNALLGLCIAFCGQEEINAPLHRAQKDLFLIGTGISSGQRCLAGERGKRLPKLPAGRIGEMEREIDIFGRQLPVLSHFILPGGSKTASLLHHARTVCRRAERRVVTLAKKEKKHAAAIAYLNRLGDLLFVMARWVNRKKRKDEIIWRGY